MSSDATPPTGAADVVRRTVETATGFLGTQVFPQPPEGSGVVVHPPSFLNRNPVLMDEEFQKVTAAATMQGVPLRINTMSAARDGLLDPAVRAAWIETATRHNAASKDAVQLAFEHSMGTTSTAASYDYGWWSNTKHNFLAGADSGILSSIGHIIRGSRDDGGPKVTRQEWEKNYAPLGIPFDSQATVGMMDYREQEALARMKTAQFLDNPGDRKDSFLFGAVGFGSNVVGGLVSDGPLLLAMGGAASAIRTGGATAGEQVFMASARGRNMLRYFGHSLYEGAWEGAVDGVTQDILMEERNAALGIHRTSDERLEEFAANVAGGVGFTVAGAAIRKGYHEYSRARTEKMLRTGVANAVDADGIRQVFAKDPLFRATVEYGMKLDDRIKDIYLNTQGVTPEALDAHAVAVDTLRRDTQSFIKDNYRDFYSGHQLAGEVAATMLRSYDLNDEFVARLTERAWGDKTKMPVEVYETYAKALNGEKPSGMELRRHYDAMLDELGVPLAVRDAMMAHAALNEGFAGSAGARTARQQAVRDREAAKLAAEKWGAERKATHEEILAKAAEFEHAAIERTGVAPKRAQKAERLSVLSRMIAAVQTPFNFLDGRFREGAFKDSRESLQRGSVPVTADSHADLHALGRRMNRDVRIITDPALLEDYRGVVWNTDPGTIYVADGVRARSAVFFHEFAHTLMVTSPDVAASILDAALSDKNGMLQGVFDARKAYGKKWNEMSEVQRMNEIIGHYIEKLVTEPAFHDAFAKEYPIASATLAEQLSSGLSVEAPGGVPSEARIAAARQIGGILGKGGFGRTIMDARRIEQTVGRLQEAYSGLRSDFAHHFATTPAEVREGWLKAHAEILAGDLESAGMAAKPDKPVKKAKSPLLHESFNEKSKEFPAGKQIPLTDARKANLMDFDAVRKVFATTEEPRLAARAADILSEFDWFDAKGQPLKFTYDENLRTLTWKDKEGREVAPTNFATSNRTVYRGFPGVDKDGRRFDLSGSIADQLLNGKSPLSALARRAMDYGAWVKRTLNGREGDRIRIPDTSVFGEVTVYGNDLRELSAFPVVIDGENGPFLTFNYKDGEGRLVHGYDPATRTKVRDTEPMFFVRQNLDDDTGDARMKESKDEGVPPNATSTTEDARNKAKAGASPEGFGDSDKIIQQQIAEEVALGNTADEVLRRLVDAKGKLKNDSPSAIRTVLMDMRDRKLAGLDGNAWRSARSAWDTTISLFENMISEGESVQTFLQEMEMAATSGTSGFDIGSKDLLADPNSVHSRKARKLVREMLPADGRRVFDLLDEDAAHDAARSYLTALAEMTRWSNAMTAMYEVDGRGTVGPERMAPEGITERSKAVREWWGKTGSKGTRYEMAARRLALANSAFFEANEKLFKHVPEDVLDANQEGRVRSIVPDMDDTAFVDVSAQTEAMESLSAAFSIHDKAWDEVVEKYVKSDHFLEAAQRDDYPEMLRGLVLTYQDVTGNLPEGSGLPPSLSGAIDSARLAQVDKAHASAISSTLGDLSAAPASRRQGALLELARKWADWTTGRLNSVRPNFDAKTKFPEIKFKYADEDVATRRARTEKAMMKLGIPQVATWGNQGVFDHMDPSDRRSLEAARNSLVAVDTMKERVKTETQKMLSAEAALDKATTPQELVAALAARSDAANEFELVWKNMLRSVVQRTSTGDMQGGIYSRGFTIMRTEGLVTGTLVDFLKNSGGLSAAERAQFLQDMTTRGADDVTNAGLRSPIRNIAARRKLKDFVKSVVDADKPTGIEGVFSHKTGVVDALYAKLVDRRLRKGVIADSVQNNVRRRKLEALSGFMETLEALGITTDFGGNPQWAKEVSDYLETGVATSPFAEQIGVTIKRLTDKELEQHALYLGGIRPSKTWPGFSVSHNVAKIVKDPAVVNGVWSQFMMDNLDWDATALHKEMDFPTQRSKEDFLFGFYKELVDDRSPRFDDEISDSNGLTGRSMHKNLVFKAGASFEYEMQFGSGNVAKRMHDSVIKLAERVALSEQLGDNPEQNIAEVLGDLGVEGWDNRRIRDTVRQLTGVAERPVNERIASWGQGVRRLGDMAVLGMTGAISMVGDMNKNFAKLQQMGSSTGILDGKVWSRYTDAWALRGDKERLGFLMKFGIGAHLAENAFSTYAHEMEGFLGGVKAVHNWMFSANMMNAIQDMNRTVFVQSAMIGFAEHAKMAADGTPWSASTARAYAMSGIDPAFMARLKGSITSGKDLGFGDVPVIDPTKLDAKAQKTLMNHILHHMQDVTLDPDAATKSLLNAGLPPGSIGGEAFRFATQYTGFLLTTPVRTWSTYRHGYGEQGFIHAMRHTDTKAATQMAAFLAGGLALGFIAYNMSRLANGEPPEGLTEISHHELAVIIAHAGVAGALSRFMTSNGRVGTAAGRLATGSLPRSAAAAVDAAANGRFADAGAEVSEAILPFFGGMVADSLHSFGRDAKKVTDQSVR